MNLLVFRRDDLDEEGLLGVSGEQLLHLRQVLDSRAGDTLRVGEIGGRMGQAEVLHIDQRRALLRPALDSNPPPKLPLTLILALPRPKMLRRVLRAVAEFGVRELHLVNSYRVEKSFWQTPVLQPDTIAHYLLQGLSQSRDTVLPAVHCQPRFKPFAEDQLPALAAQRRALLAQPGEHPPCPRGCEEDTLIAIGPEGGFIPYEVEKMIAAGLTPVSLGPRILRVENAVTALLGRLGP